MCRPRAIRFTLAKQSRMYRCSGGCSMKLTRRETLAHAPMALACTAALGRRAFAQPEESQYAEVKTAYGRLRCLKGQGLVTFKGLPYAGAVAGGNRFRP